MKSTGLVRKLDGLRRLVIPVELCRTMDIEEHTPIEIFVDNRNIVLRKYVPGCIFCNSSDAWDFKGKLVCQDCRVDLMI